MSPTDLLSAADSLLTRADEDLIGVWPRASALLARQALETSFREIWQAKAPGVERASGAAQLLCLQIYLEPPPLAQDAVLAWIGLSGACHHHPYELAPSAAELSAWFETVGRVIAVAEQLRA